MSEKYLPPDNSVRLSQENFDKLFPGYRTNQLTLVIQSDNHSKVTDQQVAQIRNEAVSISGFTDTTWQERACPMIEGNPCVSGPNGSHPKNDSVRVIQNGLLERRRRRQEDHRVAIDHAARGLTVLVGGIPALEQDSIHSLFDKAAADAGDPADHDDAADVPGVRIGGAADQGRRDERADARLDDGHLDLDLRRRSPREVAEFHRRRR